MTVQEWSQRPTEIANLLNPAFGATLIGLTVNSFTDLADRGLDFALSFLVLPLLLHEPTRSRMPRTRATNMLAWIEQNQSVLIGFTDRVRRLVPVTKEAILFGISAQTLSFDDGGMLVPGSSKLSRRTQDLNLMTDEETFCMRQATFVGRWIYDAGTAATILISWGVAP